VAEIAKKLPNIDIFLFLKKVLYLTVFVVRMSRPEKRENSPKKYENLSNLAIFYEFKSHFEKSDLKSCPIIPLFEGLKI
jgi:hypothetical protein